MRNKYFFIILVSIFSSIFLSLAFTFYYLDKEVKRSVDSQLETMASSIFASGLSVDLMDNIDDVEDLIDDAFDEERVDRFIRIYDSTTLKLLYANEFGQVAYLPLPSGNKLSTADYGHRRFRILEIKKGPIILQVALIMDSFLSRAKVLEKNILFFSGGLLLIILTITILSLRTLLRPIKLLGNDFAFWSERLSFDFNPMKLATDQLLSKIQDRQKEWKSGEVHEFLIQIHSFAKNLSKFLQFSQKQYSVLAHELKTPLTIVRNNLEYLKTTLSSDDQVRQVVKIENDIDELSQLIRNFLDWSQQAASKAKPEELFAIKLLGIVEEEIKKIEFLYPNRLKMIEHENPEIYCSKEHIQQMVFNLLKNAVVHGPTEANVIVRVKSDSLEIEDSGKGLSREVIKNLGAPFNKSINSSGHGLGLAWIKTICEIYDWKLEFFKEEGRHIVRVQFQLV